MAIQDFKYIYGPVASWRLGSTPLRPCGVSPLNKEEINAIKPYFFGLKYVTVYDSKKKKVEPISAEETLRRRGKSYFC